MITFPNAKINLGLCITEKRPDGYHNLESVFYPVGWTDVLEILPADEASFKSTGLPIPGEKATNLCLKAYILLKTDFDLPPVRMHLHKVVPIGAGLGGGSADGAFTLSLLNGQFSLGLSAAQLEEYARKLGSDCAFFIQNQPRFCFGKGDEFSETSISLAGVWAVLVNPGIHISTAEAYAGVKPRKPETDLRQALSQARGTWRETVQNEFEESLLPRYPVMARLKEKLYEAGAFYASVTGSGSTLYGLFTQQVDVSSLFDNHPVWQGVLE
ncbi:MAG: 4-(cytidine 5'-diphospho)-2-C-methyl-D-erythritol kinase [Sphingobacteriaceae bacterium]|nr:4-(cytidine 5'-diphospho)-2-C-methyl-D-erythritol kinase [Cytophagaceae bacterium]